MSDEVPGQPGTTAGHRFSGALVLVIGAGTGIGLATAERLAREGAHVGVADIEVGAAADVAASLPGSGHRPIGMDVRDPDSIGRALHDLLDDGEALDALVQVAGGGVAHGTFEQTGDEVWRDMFELNLLAPVRVVRAALPRLRRSRRGPSVTLVSSVNALLTVGSEPYSAAKAGLGPLVANLAKQFGPEGLRVNAVAPGTIRTRVWDDQGGPDRFAPYYPLRRVGEPEDVAAAIAFLCSPDAAWITGHTLPVDGGLLVRGPFDGPAGP